MAEIKPQLSLFDNNKCTQCDKDIKEGFVYCNDCSKKWVDKYLNPDRLKDNGKN